MVTRGCELDGLFGAGSPLEFEAIVSNHPIGYLLATKSGSHARTSFGKTAVRTVAGSLRLSESTRRGSDAPVRDSPLVAREHPIGHNSFRFNAQVVPGVGVEPTRRVSVRGF
jgi:hypothetical protein